MFDHFPLWVPAATAVLVFVCLGPSLPMKQPWIRAGVAAFAIVLCVRYLIWRTVETMLPQPFEFTAASLWMWLFYAAEVMLLCEALVFILMMSRRRDRHAEADDNQRWFHAQSIDSLPTVDVLVPTYNEGWDVLQKTLVGALALDYPKVEVHVLDDGARDWLQTECALMGVNYIRRPDRAHAKAGNINHALGITHNELVLVFDADFVAQRDFLQRTVGFFRDPRVGLVQVPHHFFNTDPVQANLGVFQKHADDQEYFFTDIMAARDAWGVAFSCGSNSLARRTALTQMNGIPTGSITEDILTSIVLLQHGWRTVYLNERLARGLAPEGLSAMYTQRARWARGGIQLLFLPIGPLRAEGLTFIQRLFFLPLSWIATNLGLPVMLLGPLLFLWTGLVALPTATGDDLLAYQVPMLLATWGASRALSTVHRNTLIALAGSVFATFRLAPAVLHSLFFPFAVGFKVTPKGKLAQGMAVDTRAFGVSIGVIVLMIGGLVINQMPDYERVPPSAFLTPSMFWGALTVLVMFACLLMAFEFDRRRAEERFVIRERHSAMHDGQRRDIDVIDLSTSGGAIRWGVTRPLVGELIELHLTDVGHVTCLVVRHIGDVGIGVQFQAPSVQIERLIVAKIFTHAYENEGKATVNAEGLGIWRRLAGPKAVRTAPAWSMLTVNEPAPQVRGLRPTLDAVPEVTYPRLMPQRPLLRVA